MQTARRAIHLLLLILFFTAPLAASVAVTASATAKQPAVGRYVVTLAPGTRDIDATVQALAKQYDAKVLATWRVVLKGFWAQMSGDNALALQRDKRVATVEHDAPMRESGVAPFPTNVAPPGGHTNPATTWPPYTNNPKWHLSRITHRDKSDDDLWYRLGHDGTGARVYLFDTGVWSKHQEFVGAHLDDEINAAARPDHLPFPPPRDHYTEVAPDPALPDTSRPFRPCTNIAANEAAADAIASNNSAYHGTATASLVVGQHVGVAPGAGLVSVTVSPCEDDEVGFTTAVWIGAFEEVLTHYQQNPLPTPQSKRIPSVISISAYAQVEEIRFRAPDGTDDEVVGECGHGDDTGCVRQPALTAFEDAINTVIDAGIPVIVSANNQGTDACSTIPARLSRRSGRLTKSGHRTRVITVGGIDHDDKRWVGFVPGSERGSNYGQCVDIWAPAARLIVARPFANNDFSTYTSPLLQSGTSFAAPIVAAVTARMLAEDSDLSDDSGLPAGTFSQTATKVWERLQVNATRLDRDNANLGGGSPDLLVYLAGVTFEQQPPPLLETTGDAAALGVVIHSKSDTTHYSYQWQLQTSDPSDPSIFIWQPAPGTNSAATYTAATTGKYRARVWECPEASPCPISQFRAESNTTSVVLNSTMQCQLPSIAMSPSRFITRASEQAPVTTTLSATTSSTVGFSWTWKRLFPEPMQLTSGMNSVPPLSLTQTKKVGTYQLELCGCSGNLCVSDTAEVRLCNPPVSLAVEARDSDADEFAQVDVVQPSAGNSFIQWLFRKNSLEPWKPLRLNLENSELPGQPRWKLYFSNSVNVWKSGQYAVLTANDCATAISPAFATVTQACRFNAYGRGPGDNFSSLQAALHTYSVPYNAQAIFQASASVVQEPPVPVYRYLWPGNYSDIPSVGASSSWTSPPVVALTTFTVSITDSLQRTDCERTITFTAKPDDSPCAFGVRGKSSSEAGFLEPGYLSTHPYALARGDGFQAAIQTHVPQGRPAGQYTYKWYVNGLLKDGAETNTFALQSIVTNTMLRVVVTSLSDVACSHELTFVLTVPCPPKPRRRATRSLRSGGGTSFATEDKETIDSSAPGQSVRLAVEEDEGVTYSWYEGDDYNHPVRAIGNGPEIDVAPLTTTTYWVTAAACGATANSDYFEVRVQCVTILKQPDASTVIALSGSTASTSASVEAVGSTTRPLHYKWYDAASGTAIPDTDSPTYLFSGVSPKYQDVFVEAFVFKLNSNGSESTTSECVVRSRTVRLAVIPVEPQRFFFRDSGADIYSPSLPQKLQVIMDPPQSADHDYTYAWYRDDGTPDGEPTGADSPELLVTTDGIDTFWVKVTGAHNYSLNGAVISYEDRTVSPRMYVSLHGTCEMPPLKVSQNLVQIPPNTSAPVTFIATCDWPDVTFEWFGGQTGDTRDPASSDVGKPNQLTVATGSIHPYWVRARRACGAVQDSPTLTFRREPCGPVLINQELQSVEVEYGNTTSLSVSPLFEGTPAYTWYQNEGQGTPVVGQDYSPTLRRENVTTSGRYWVNVRNLACSNGADSYLATIRVASHPAITPPDWQAEVWTDSGTSILLTGTSGGASSYQWYLGEVGDDRAPIGGATLATYLTPNLTQETKYWVRVSESGGGIVDSPTMTVKICVRPRVTGTSLTTLNLEQGQAVYLDATATGTNITYQWYQGGNGAGNYVNGTPVGRSIDRLLIEASSNTTYWLAVTGRCAPDPTGSSVALSPVFRVSVCPDIVGDELPTATRTLVTSGETTTLTIDVDGAEIIEWYKVVGTSPAVKFDEGSALTKATVPSPPITAETSFYAIARNGTCSRTSGDVTIQVCSTPNVHWAGGNPKQITKGQQFFLVTGLAPGETANFKWYRGTTSGDVANSTLVSQSSNAYQLVLQTTTSFWVRASNEETGCYSDTPVHTVNVCVPTIVTQPNSQTINSGATATLSVTTDLAGMQYQWFRGAVGDTTTPVTGHSVVDQTSSITVTPTADTPYWVRVTGCTGAGLTPVTRDSQAAVITVCQVPTITTQPSSIWMTTSNTPLSVVATGTELTYQWYKGLSGDTSLPQSSTSASFTVAPSQTTNYWVRVSGRCGTPQNSATVKVSVKPSMNGQPIGGPITKGTTRALTVGVNGTELTYQWYLRPASGPATVVTGATSASYTPPPVMADATYFVRVYSGIAYDNSADATFTVCLPREINVVGYPSGHSGSQVVLQVPDATADETFEWYRGPAGNTSDPIGGGTLKYLNPQVTTQYWVRTKRTGCDADSAVVTINICYPKMNTEPEATSLIASGTTKTLTVNVTGTAPLVYQWYRGASGDTSTPVGTNSSVFTTPALTASTTYWVRISTNAAACATKGINSQSATVNVCQPPVITAQPQASTVNKNLSYTISVTATGDNLHYQWYIGDSGVTTTPVGTDSDQLPVVAGTTKKYWVRITGTCGVVDSIAALQSVRPIITSHPVDATVCGLGGMATFTVTATGADAYTWYRYTSGVQDIVGTTRTITIPVPNASATFRVVVSSGVATATSVMVGVNIIPVPTVTSFTATQETSTRWLLSAPTPGGQGSIKYRFYEGALGDTSILLTDTTASYYRVYPSSRPKTYWVRVYFTDTGCATDRAVTIN